MAAYSQFLGRTVTVEYRVGEVLQTASGTFVGDSGRSIFLEQHIEQRGRKNYFRWEIPYQYVHLIHETSDSTATQTVPESDPDEIDPAESTPRLAARAATASSGGSSLLSMPRRPKTA